MTSEIEEMSRAPAEPSNDVWSPLATLHTSVRCPRDAKSPNWQKSVCQHRSDMQGVAWEAEINECSVFCMFLCAMQTPHELWRLRLVCCAMPMADGSKFVSSRHVGRRSAMVFAPSSCRLGGATLLASCRLMPQLMSLSSKACTSTRMHGLLVGRPRPCHLAFAWLNMLHAITHPNCTRSKNSARDPTLIEQSPWLDEYVGRPREKILSTRRAAAAESRTSVEDEVVDRDSIQVAWDGFSAVTESCATAPVFSGEASFHPTT